MTASDLSRLAHAYERSRAYVESLSGRAQQGDLSGFWAQHFSDRPNFPTFNDMLVLRRGGFTYGVGEVSTTANEEAERQWARATRYTVRASAPELDLNDWPESAVGAPYTFELDGVRRSGSAMINALTSHRVAGWCFRLGLNRPLRVLEIGPGYGQGALQLIGKLPIERYSICDLPENLLLSSYYLQVAQSNLAVSFVGADERLEGVVFATPPDIERLEGPFDVVVNAYSLQEMNLDSVRTYYDFIARTLAPDGFFYSLNSHGKAGVKVPGDYAVERFRVAHFGPIRRFPFYLFATEPYELVLTHGSQPSGSKEEFEDLAVLLQFGFIEELIPLCERFVLGQLSVEDRDWLRAARLAYAGGEVSDRHQMLSGAPDIVPAATALIAGALRFSEGEDEGL